MRAPGSKRTSNQAHERDFNQQIREYFHKLEPAAQQNLERLAGGGASSLGLGDSLELKTR